MNRSILVLAALGLTSCGKLLGGCHEPLKYWCFHEEGEEGPVLPDDVRHPQCDEPTLTETAGDPPTWGVGCGDYFELPVGLGGFTSEVHYFDRESGELVGVKYGTDTNHYCGGFTFEYGKVPRKCEADCTFDELDESLPRCE